MIPKVKLVLAYAQQQASDEYPRRRHGRPSFSRFTFQMTGTLVDRFDRPNAATMKFDAQSDASVGRVIEEGGDLVVDWTLPGR